jgi:hypothetical protein
MAKAISIIFFVGLIFTPFSIAQATLPSSIEGIPIPSQGKEGNYEGFFMISDITQINGNENRGSFVATIIFSFTGGPGPDRQVFMIGEIYGVFKVQKGNIMIQISGEGFRGQFRSDPSGFLIGFINTPGNGFLSQVFVAGIPA